MDESLNQDIATKADFLVIQPRRALVNALRWARAHLAELLCAALLTVMSLQMLFVISRKSITVDEIVMIPSAYYHLAAGDFRFVNEHPPLAKLLAAIPFLFIQPNEGKPQESGAATISYEKKWAYQADFWDRNPTIFQTISFWTRVPMIILTIGLGLLIFRFTRELFGARAAVLAVALFSHEPTVLAHGRVVQTDIPAAFGYLLLFMALYHYAKSRTWRRAAWLGGAAGIAILAKFSMLLVGPVLAVFFLVLWWRASRSGQPRWLLVRQAGLVGLAALLVINAAYFFEHRQFAEADAQWIQTTFPVASGPIVWAARVLSHLVPTDFVLGVLFQIWHNNVGHTAGLLGMYSRRGWWYYIPIAFALKTTLPFLLLSLASVAWGVYQWLRKKDHRFLWLLAPFAVYTIFVLFSHIAIGVRYYLPAYTLLFILGGALLDQLLRLKAGRRAGALVAVALLGWIAIEAGRAYPNHMSYMNQIAGRAPHWWYLSDSNVEWGDETQPLAAYLRERGETKVRGAFLGGFFTLHQYGVDYVDALTLKPAHSPPRYTALGASFLNGSTVPDKTVDGHWLTETERVNFFDAYRHRTPEAVFGDSIYLYREDGH
jgi:hypothetical protein